MRSALRIPTAFAVSTAAHVALLGALLLGTPHRPAPRVRLLPWPAEATYVRIESSGPSEAAPVARLPLPTARARRASAPRPVNAAAPEEASGAPSLAPSATTEAAAALGLFTTREAAGAGAVGESGANPTAGPGGASGDSRLEELHRRLAAAAVRCYPAAARRFRLTGEVPVHFCLDAAGTPTGLSLQGSTGSSLLDRSALECVVPGAQPLPGFEGCFLVPVHFGG